MASGRDRDDEAAGNVSDAEDDFLSAERARRNWSWRDGADSVRCHQHKSR